MKRPFKHPLSPTKNRCLWGIFMSCALLSQGTRVCHPIGVLPLCEGAAVSLTPVIRKHLLCTNRMPENWQTDRRLPPQMSLSKQCELRPYTWKSYTQSRAGSALAEIALRLTKSQFITADSVSPSAHENDVCCSAATKTNRSSISKHNGCTVRNLTKANYFISSNLSFSTVKSLQSLALLNNLQN